ncbi:hypothetical protein BJ508DRAFT_18503 [Ascobolus immersus RN42]|uniref:Uncharacterized protein n=1 Tax=Ascobolus immersus RN42 TaxID=1160509 RepID=A0A3N4HSW3_ASCIM|nr:hypothetical protein BJ508DRAFT_18503 [Ascobolus immersus RN42]
MSLPTEIAPSSPSSLISFESPPDSLAGDYSDTSPPIQVVSRRRSLLPFIKKHLCSIILKHERTRNQVDLADSAKLRASLDYCDDYEPGGQNAREKDCIRFNLRVRPALAAATDGMDGESSVRNTTVLRPRYYFLHVATEDFNPTRELSHLSHVFRCEVDTLKLLQDESSIQIPIPRIMSSSTVSYPPLSQAGDEEEEQRQYQTRKEDMKKGELKFPWLLIEGFNYTCRMDEKADLHDSVNYDILTSLIREIASYQSQLLSLSVKKEFNGISGLCYEDDSRTEISQCALPLQFHSEQDSWDSLDRGSDIAGPFTTSREWFKSRLELLNMRLGSDGGQEVTSATPSVADDDTVGTSEPETCDSEGKNTLAEEQTERARMTTAGPEVSGEDETAVVPVTPVWAPQPAPHAPFWRKAVEIHFSADGEDVVLTRHRRRGLGLGGD